MRIGFDAKRAFFNFSGLGNYSRNTIRSLREAFPENDYHLYIPKRRKYIPEGGSEKYALEYPTSWTGRKLSSFWRSYWLGRRLEADGIELFHGLSNEIPFSLPGRGIKSVVTIHDLIFLRYPEWYAPIDRRIYTRKARFACQHADRIISISEQTKKDIIQFFGTPEERIDVIYQGCDPIFHKPIDDAEKSRLKAKFGLEPPYLLYVGTIEPRKNLMQIVRAMRRGSIDLPLVVIGRQTSYAEKVKSFIEHYGMNQIKFLKEVPNEELPGIYQMASVFIYPSIFEGFGIPILEALYSGTPVITTRGGVFAEAGGPESIYVDHDNPDEILEAVRTVLDDPAKAKKMGEAGKKHALKFGNEDIAGELMKIYRKVL